MSDWDDLCTLTFLELVDKARQTERKLVDIANHPNDHSRAALDLRIDASYLLAEFIRRGTTRPKP